VKLAGVGRAGRAGLRPAQHPNRAGLRPTRAGLRPAQTMTWGGAPPRPNLDLGAAQVAQVTLTWALAQVVFI